MANVKISQLPAATAVTGDDLLPIVENGATQTQKAEFSQVLSYITSSTFDTLTVTSLTASMEGNASTSDQVNTQDASTSTNNKNIIFVENLTGYQDVETDSSLTYSPVANRINVSTIRLGLGSTSSPVITTEDPTGPTGSNDTGIYFPDKDTIGFTVDNFQKVRIDDAGLLVNGSLVADVEVSFEITSPTYTLTSTDRGKTLLFNSGTAQTITCPSGLDTGFNITAIQLGTGQLNFVGSGVTLVNRFGHSSSAGQYSAVSVIVISATQHLVVGDTA